jgi:cyclophilin family peptidyl-prolyl cis-trans isomerase
MSRPLRVPSCRVAVALARAFGQPARGQGLSIAVALALVLTTTSVVAQSPARTSPALDLRSAILTADDARVRDAAHRQTIETALRNNDLGVRGMALRAIGRTQRAEFLPEAVAALTHASTDVRCEAAFAVAHIGNGAPDALAGAEQALRDALGREADAVALSALAEEYGRLPFPDAPALERAAVTLRTSMARLAVDGVRNPIVALGVARGAEAMARRAAWLKVDPMPLAVLLHDDLFRLGQPPGTSPDPLDLRVRRLALAGLMTRERPSPEAYDEAVTDPDPQVRRLGVIAVARRQELTAERVRPWLKDEAVLVRHAVVARLGARFPGIADTALADAHLNVRLAALDALGERRACHTPCLSRVEHTGAFASAWHEGAHALEALARTDAQVAAPYVTRASSSSTWQARMYAARAARHTRQADVLATLAADANVNVRHAALVSWREAALPGLVDAAVAALRSDDGQLVLEAAGALKDQATSPPTTMVDALREALARVTAQRRETSRDPRMALLERLDEWDPDRERTLRMYLSDFDAAIAARAATLIDARRPTGAPRTAAAPRPLPPARVPTWDEVARLDGRIVRVTLRDGRELALRLDSLNAPTAVARLVSQVHAGEWDGRTFHRVEPGFVVQGGSPAANEYAGAAAFARDEFSAVSHARGTVGISTRGPDTGDGQIFINLVDNARLDFGFTIIGTIVGGLAVIDDIAEGEVIERAAMVGSAR